MAAAETIETDSPAVQAVLAYVDAWNAHDPAAIRACFTADGELHDPFKPHGLKAEAIQAFAQETIGQFPTVRFELQQVHAVRHDTICFELECSVMVTPPGAGAAKRVVLKACDVAELRHGKFVQLRSYFDRASIAEQLQA